MSENNGRNKDADEAETLAADDPRRAALLTATDPARREALLRAWAEADEMRGMLAKVQPPADLQSRLLAIPDALRTPAVPTVRMGKVWGAIAAAVLVAALLAGALVWRPWVPKPQPLMASLRQSIAVWAVKNAGTPLDVTSGDADVVQKRLAGYGMDFPVAMLSPTGNLTLEGGGSCDFGPAKAVYTRWAGDGYACTLYEFNGADVGAPPLFNTAPETPTELWRNDMHYRVIIFPGQGGKCCWALVMDTDKAVNNFSKYTTGTY